MDTVSFAVGYALGRKKGGGSSSQNTIFHNIVDRFCPVYTHNIDAVFKWVLGVWQPGADDFGLPDVYNGAYYNTWRFYGSAEPSGTSSTGYHEYSSIICPATTSFVEVIVMYKNNVPIYALFRGSVGGIEPQYKMLNYYPNPDGAEHEAVLWKYFGDFLLDSCELISADISISDILSFYGGYSGNIQYRMNFSIQYYTAERGSIYELPVVTKDGDRLNTYSTETTRNPCIFSNVYGDQKPYGAFTDMSPEMLLKTSEEILCAVYKANGKDTRVGRIIEPSG